MGAIQSILWIGKARHFAADIVADAPGLDVVWERNPAQAARIGGGGFNAVVLEADDADQALAVLATLVPDAGAPVLVRIAPRQAERTAELLAAGAADVALRGGPSEESDLLARIERLARPVRRSIQPPMEHSATSSKWTANGFSRSHLKSVFSTAALKNRRSIVPTIRPLSLPIE